VPCLCLYGRVVVDGRVGNQGSQLLRYTTSGLWYLHVVSVSAVCLLLVEGGRKGVVPTRVLY
jgi:hypothetical protein